MTGTHIYHLLSFLALPFALLYHWYRSVTRGRKPAFNERFGFIPDGLRQKLSGHPLIWLHAVSVGEVIAARPLMRALRVCYPDYRLLLSVTTETGRNVAERDTIADGVIYFPFDVLPAVGRLLDQAAPRLVIVMETEIWPVFISEIYKRSIPLFLANGRISERSFPRYRRFAWFFQPVLAKFSRLAMQSTADYERIIAIGSPQDRTTVLGNLKYDIPYCAVALDERNRLRETFGLNNSDMVITAGSTHPGEEECLLDAFSRLRELYANLVLVLVPRHPERAAEVEAVVNKSGHSCTRLSVMKQSKKPLASHPVLLVDTVGELMQLYALAEIAFVGGSLVPTGGHNLLEPASRGVPFIFGPSMESFKEIKMLVLEHGAGVQVADRVELGDALRDFLASEELRQVIGSNGLKLMRCTGGATDRHMDAIRALLKP